MEVGLATFCLLIVLLDFKNKWYKFIWAISFFFASILIKVQLEFINLIKLHLSVLVAHERVLWERCKTEFSNSIRMHHIFVDHKSFLTMIKIHRLNSNDATREMWDRNAKIHWGKKIRTEMFVFASVLACYRNVMKQKKVLDITAGEWEQLAT